MDRKTDEFWSVSLFWPEQLGVQKGVIQPVKKRRKRCKYNMEKTTLSQSACSTAGVSLALWDSTVLRLNRMWQSRVEIKGHSVARTSIALLPTKCHIAELPLRAGLICAS